MTLSNRLSFFDEDQLELMREKTFALLEQHEFKIDHPEMIALLDKWTLSSRVLTKISSAELRFE